jgi:hypothetical protein
MKQRWQRFWGHSKRMGVYPQHPLWYSMERVLLLADALFLPEILTTFHRLFKWNSRRLNARERALARSVFGDIIDIQRVRMDERSYIGCRQGRFAYVSFNLINSWGPLTDAHFIHELVHVWQFQQFGSVYIPRALWAQRTKEGYDYGGYEAVRMAAEQGRGLDLFNFEQQGDLIADYFCLKNNLKPRWCQPDPACLACFEQVVSTACLNRR